MERSGIAGFSFNTALLLAAGIHGGHACSPPDPATHTVFNRITPEGMGSDSELVAAYGCKYIFARVADGPQFQPYTRLSGDKPANAMSDDGLPLAGRVFIAYIVTRNGRVADPVVMNTSDPRLASVALQTLKRWRFRPATYKQQPVPSLAVQEFSFGSP